MKPPYGFFMMPRPTHFDGYCWYCGETVPAGSRTLYSKKLRLLAHAACRGEKD